MSTTAEDLAAYKAMRTKILTGAQSSSVDGQGSHAFPALEFIEAQIGRLTRKLAEEARTTAGPRRLVADFRP